jgi:hypothetical protein
MPRVIHSDLDRLGRVAEIGVRHDAGADPRAAGRLEIFGVQASLGRSYPALFDGAAPKPLRLGLG